MHALLSRFTLAAALTMASFSAHAQAPSAPSTTTTTTSSTPATPSYFTTTGGRFSYYDGTLTETTNIGVHVTGAQDPDTPKGLWATLSIDATPKSQASSAAIRLGSRYFIKALAGGNVITYANIAAGATTSTTAAVSAASSSTVSAGLLGNLQGGGGFVWRVCHTFDKNSKVNCLADLDWELNAVTSQSTKPILGFFVGVAF